MTNLRLAQLRAELGIRAAFASGLRPPPRVTVSQWAERCRTLSSKASSEPGRWRNDRNPPLVEIMDALSADSPVERVVFKKGSQVGGTEIGLNLLGYVIEHAPCPVMLVMPSEKTQKRGGRQRLDELFDLPSLRGRVHDRKSRDPGQTALLKDFAGGILALCTANSASDLRSMPARILIADEIDAFPVEIPNEGDPVELAERATRSYGQAGRLRKLYYVSSPTTSARGISVLFATTDRRFYHVPCPSCGELQRLVWSHVRWEGRDEEGSAEKARRLEEEPGAVWYQCASCEERIPEWRKPWMFDPANGARWIPEAPELSGRTRGYHLSSLYSPLGQYSWASCAASWIKAQKQPAKLRVFFNQTLGLEFDSKVDPPPWETLYRRREQYELGVVPEGGLVLTAGVDVQADRIVVEVVAWGRDLESWSLRYFTLPGEVERPEAWAMLATELSSLYPLEVNRQLRLPVQAWAIDSSAFTSTVYKWVALQRRANVWCVKGDDRLRFVVGIPRPVDTEISGTVRGRRRGVLLYPVGVSLLKEELYGLLRLEPPLEDADPFPPGYCHHPEYEQAYFQELTAESLAERMVRGYRRTEWVKTRPRNEALDCRNYARAAAEILGLSRRSPEDWQALEDATLAGAMSPPPPDAPPHPRPPPRAGGEDYWKDGDG